MLPEPFTGSNDLEAYITHFELLATLQKWKRTEGDTEIDERPHYFAFRLQKGAIDYYKTLPEATQTNYDELVKSFRTHYNEKPVVFRGRLAKRVQQPGEKLTDFLGELQKLALKAYPADSEEVREHLVVRGFLEGINNTQVRLDLRKTLQDDEMEIQTVLEKALHLEAVTRIEEEEKEYRVSSIIPDSASRLVDRLNELVAELKVKDEGRGAARNDRRSPGGRDDQRSRNFSRERSASRQGYDRGGRDGNRARNRSPTPGARFRSSSRESRRDGTFDGGTRSRENTRGRVEFSGRQEYRGRSQNNECYRCGQEGHTARECRNCYHCGSPNHIKRNCPYLN